LRTTRKTWEKWKKKCDCGGGGGKGGGGLGVQQMNQGGEKSRRIREKREGEKRPGRILWATGGGGEEKKKRRGNF